MAILERTPPRRWAARDSGGSNVSRDVQQQQQRSHEPAEKTFVFPSLEEMATNGGPERGHQAAASTSSARVSPEVSRTLKAKVQSRSRNTPSVSPVVHYQRPTPSQASPSQLKSPERQALDDAFQAQIERAIASGENPFTDRRRAAMRDDANTSGTPATGATGRDSLTRERRATEIRQERVVTTKPAYVQSNDDSIKVLDTPPVVREVTRTVQRIPTPPQTNQPPSPPMVLFTPRRTTVSGQGAQTIPVAQQEELQKLRNEVFGYRSQLRDAQLAAERCQEEAKESRQAYSEERSRGKALHRQIRTLEDDLDQLEVQAKDAQRQVLRQSELQKRQFDQARRAQDIVLVVARNEITYTNAQRQQAVAELEAVRGKRAQSGQEWKAERKELLTELEELRVGQRQRSSRIKQLERESGDGQAQLEKLRDDLEREQRRRKDAVQRGNDLQAEIDELQGVSSREASLRKELSELKRRLREQEERLEEEQERHRLALQTVKSAQIPTSSPRKVKGAIPAGGSHSSKVTGIRHESRRRMQDEVESSMIDDDFSFHREEEQEEVQPVVEEVKKAKVTAKSTVRAKETDKLISKPQKTTTRPIQDSPAREVPTPASPVKKTSTAAEVKRKVVPVEPVRERKTSMMVPPKPKASTTSILSRGGAAATARSSVTTAAATSSDPAPPRRALAAKPRESTSYDDETMKTPLLPSKRARAVMNAYAEREEADEEEEEKDAPGVRPGKRIAAPVKQTQKARLSEQAEATPMVRIDPEKKRRRKLLKTGTNVASNFLSSRADADGGLAPTLNLPIELSPLKPGEAASNTLRGRLGGGGAAAAGSSNVAGSLFARGR